MFRIRTPLHSDLPAIVEIFNQAIPGRSATACTQPVTIAEREAWFRNHSPDQYPIFVAEIDGCVSGWISVSPYRPGREAHRFIAEISYYVHQDFQRRGVATALLEHVIAACPTLGIKDLYGVILERNQASIHLLAKCGFKKWGYLPRIANFDGEECGVYYYGKRVWDPVSERGFRR
jgi:L-amino acid N-acyltransferase YncA